MAWILSRWIPAITWNVRMWTELFLNVDSGDFEMTEFSTHFSRQHRFIFHGPECLGLRGLTSLMREYAGMLICETIFITLLFPKELTSVQKHSFVHISYVLYAFLCVSISKPDCPIWPIHFGERDFTCTPMTSPYNETNNLQRIPNISSIIGISIPLWKVLATYAAVQ